MAKAKANTNTEIIKNGLSEAEMAEIKRKGPSHHH